MGAAGEVTHMVCVHGGNADASSGSGSVWDCNNDGNAPLKLQDIPCPDQDYI